MTESMDPKAIVTAFHQASSRYDFDQPETVHTPTSVPVVQLTNDIPNMRLDACISARLSCRNFGAEPFSLAALGAILHAAYGHLGALTALDQTLQTRPVPSASGTYALSALVFVRAVEGVAPAIYRYQPDDATLQPIADLPDAPELKLLFLQQAYMAQAPVAIVLTARPDALTELYGERGYRFALIEAGHVVQNMVLASAALGAGCCPMGGFEDYRICCAAGLDPALEWPLYGAALGMPDPAKRADLRKPEGYGDHT